MTLESHDLCALMSNPTARNSLTVDDIHNIRFKNYEKIKSMSHKEIIEHTRREAEYGLNQLEKLSVRKGKRG